jgi:N4-gp56 family major capsid protein
VSDLFNMTSISKPVTDAIELLSDSAALTIDSYYKDTIGFGQAASTGVTGAASATYLSCFSEGFPTLHNSVVSWATVPLVNNTASTALSVDRVRTAVTTLRGYNCRPMDDGYYVGIIHPVIADKIMQDNSTGGWTAWNQYTNPDAMYKGEIGKLHGVRFVDSTNAMTSTVKASAWSAGSSNFSAGGTLYGTLIFGKGAYAGVMMEAGNGVNTYVVPNDKAEKADPLAQWGSVGYKITMAAKILNASCGIIAVDYISN